MNMKIVLTSITDQAIDTFFMDARRQLVAMVEHWESIDLIETGVSFLGFVFILVPEGRHSLWHFDGMSQAPGSEKGKLKIEIQRHVDYQQFLSSDEAGRLALLARALLEGVLELPKARGLKRFDARGLHGALLELFVAKGVMELEENL